VVNGTTATLTVTSAQGGKAASSVQVAYTFNAPLNTGLVGVGTNNSLASYTSYSVLRLPINFTYSVLEDLSDGVAQKFTPATGTWTTTGGTTGVYSATPPANDAALSVRSFNVAPLSYVEYSATVNASKAGAYAGLTFGYTSTNSFLYAAVIAGTNQVVLGHRDAGSWSVDAVASANISAGTNYSLTVALSEGTTNNVTVLLNGKAVLSFNYNYLVHDGNLGLMARNGNASFDNILIRGDDIAYAGGGIPQSAATAATEPDTGTTVTAEALDTIVAAAKQLWAEALGPRDPRLAILDQVAVLISDLPDNLLGATTGTTIVLDTNAAGWGWFVDLTPLTNGEFQKVLAAGVFAAESGSPAYGRMDLLSTILHELGNAMGIAESASDDVTGATLSAGTRRLPESAFSLDAHHPIDSAVLSGGVVATGVAANAGIAISNLIAPPSIPTALPTAPPAGSPASNGMASTAVSGIVPASTIVLPPSVAAQFASQPASNSTAGSFVNLEPSGTGAGQGTIQVQTSDDAAPIGGSHSLPSNTAAGDAPMMLRGNERSAWSNLASATDESQDWLNDFLNHLGRSEAQRNPNAGLRIRPSSNA
jgi:hypothetical protein